MPHPLLHFKNRKQTEIKIKKCHARLIINSNLTVNSLRQS